MRWPCSSGRSVASVMRLTGHGNETCCSERGYKLAAQVRPFDTGHNRKTDAVDAHSMAPTSPQLRPLPSRLRYSP
jgi:hypothetical protein